MRRSHFIASTLLALLLVLATGGRADNADYAEHLGLRWQQVGRPALSRRALEDALSADPKREKSWRGLAVACQRLEQPACEATAWEGLIQHFGDEEARWLAADAAWRAAGEPERVLALWADVTRRRGDDRLAALRYAQALREAGRHEEALGYARRAVALWPTSREATLLLGELYLERGDLRAAQAEFERGLRAHPGDPHLQTGLRRALGYGPQ